MKELKYGIKLWSTNHNLYSELVHIYKSGRIDYLELLFVPEKIEEIDLLIRSKLPLVVHAPTFNQKVVFADDNFKKNKKILSDIFEFAKKLNTQDIIIHPDIGQNKNFIRFLKENKNKKLIIENMPKLAVNGSNCLGCNINEINKFLSIGNFDFCLDFAHAIKSAISQGIDYKEFLTDFISLKPKIAHLSDGKLDNERDEHLNLGEGEFDLKFIANLIINSSIEKITFEIPKKDGLKNDLKNIEYFKRLLNHKV